MGHIIIVILKIIGIILLVILGLLLTLLLAVLLIPVRYKLKASYIGNSPDLFLRISWLLRLLQVQVTLQGGKTLVKVKLFGFAYRKKGKVAKQEVTHTALDMIEISLEGDEDILSATEIPSLPDPKEPERIPKENASENNASEKKEKRNRKKRKPADDFQNPSEGLQEKWQKGLSFLEDEELKTVIALIIKLINKMARHVLPLKFSGYFRFGFEDPATTGGVVAFLSMFYAVYSPYIDLIPEFNETVLEGKVELKGRIRSLNMLLIGLRLIVNKSFRRQLGKLKG